MTVTIREMQLPDRCGHCCTVYSWGEKLMCGIRHDEVGRYGRPAWCPLEDPDANKKKTGDE